MNRWLKAVVVILFAVDIIHAGDNIDLINKCVRNSGDNNFEMNLWVHHYDYFKCIGEDFTRNTPLDYTYRYPKFVNLLIDAVQKYAIDGDTSEIFTYREKLCPAFGRVAKTCLPNYFSAFEPCFVINDPEIKKLSSSPEKYLNISQFICDTFEGHSIYDLSDRDFLRCALPKTDEFTYCLDNLFSAKYWPNFPLVEADETYKRLYVNFSSCCQQILDDCDQTSDKISASLVRELAALLIDSDLVVQLQQFYEYIPGIYTNGPDVSRQKVVLYKKIVEAYKNDPKRVEMINYLKTMI